MNLGQPRTATEVVVLSLPGFRLLEKLTITETLEEAVRSGITLSVRCVDIVDPAEIAQHSLLPVDAPAAVFVCGGEQCFLETVDLSEQQLAHWLDGALCGDCLVCGVGGGVGFLAKYGFLNGRKAVAKHSMLEHLADRFPLTGWSAASVVQDGNLITCGGMLSALDATLAVLQGLGHHSKVSRIARSLVSLTETQSGSEKPILPAIPAVHPALQRVDDLLRKDPTFPWTTCALADSVYVSERHLQRLFREVLGYGVFDYLQRKRLARAVEVLESHPVMSLQRVAELAGFSSTQHLRRAWRKHFGANPSASREGARSTRVRRQIADSGCHLSEGANRLPVMALPLHFAAGNSISSVQQMEDGASNR